MKRRGLRTQPCRALLLRISDWSVGLASDVHGEKGLTKVTSWIWRNVLDMSATLWCQILYTSVDSALVLADDGRQYISSHVVIMFCFISIGYMTNRILSLIMDDLLLIIWVPFLRKLFTLSSDLVQLFHTPHKYPTAVYSFSFLLHVNKSLYSWNVLHIYSWQISNSFSNMQK